MLLNDFVIWKEKRKAVLVYVRTSIYGCAVAWAVRTSVALLA